MQENDIYRQSLLLRIEKLLSEYSTSPSLAEQEPNKVTRLLELYDILQTCSLSDSYLVCVDASLLNDYWARKEDRYGS